MPSATPGTTGTTPLVTALPRPRAERHDLAATAAPDFVAVDLEAINGRAGSVCSIGLVVVRGGVVVDEFEGLCHPDERFGAADWRHMAVNRLFLGDVHHAGTFAALLGLVDAFVGGLPVVSHDADADAAHLRAACAAAGVAVPAWDWSCSEELAGAALGLRSTALADVVSALGLPRFAAHQASADARAVAGVVTELARRGGHASLASLLAAHAVASADLSA